MANESLGILQQISKANFEEENQHRATRHLTDLLKRIEERKGIAARYTKEAEELQAEFEAFDLDKWTNDYYSSRD